MAVPALVLAHENPPALVSLARWLASLWPTTAQTYREALGYIALVLTGSRDLDAVPWDRIDHAALGMLREQLAQRYSHATVNRTLAAMRSLARQLARDHVIPRDQEAGIRDVQNIGGRLPRAKVGRALTPDEQTTLFSVAKSSQSAPRLKCVIVTLLLAGGLRKGEAAHFLMSDLSAYDPATGCLTVLGKGRKARVVYFAGTAKQALDDFVADDDRGWRFRKLGTSQINRILRRLEQRAGVQHFTPHDCRRTYASTQLGRGVDIATVQQLMGHASPAQTAAYDRRADDAKRAAALDPWA